MKISKYILALSTGLLLCSSCSDVLEEEPLSVITADAYYNTEEGYETLISAGYENLRRFYGSDHGFTFTTYGVDTYTEGKDGPRKEFNNYGPQLNPRSDWAWEIWSFLYVGINTTNAAISRAEQAPLDQEVLNQRLGEAHFLRGLYYSLLVQLWGDVHVTTEETTEVTLVASRTAAAQIYSDVIISDLEFAIANLPATQVDYGRATEPTAKAVLARVHLTLGNWEAAAALAQSVISDYDFALLDNFGDLWNINNQRNSEVVWAVQHTQDVILNNIGTGRGGNFYEGGNQGHLFFLMKYDDRPGMRRDTENGRPFVRYRPTEYTLNLFDQDADERYRDGFKFVFFANNPNGLPEGMSLGDTAIFVSLEDVPDDIQAAKVYQYYDYQDVVNSDQVWPTLIKFLDPVRPSTGAKSGSRDFFVVRLAEMYLVAAEAAWRLGDAGEAARLINVIRERAAVDGQRDAMLVSESDIDLDFILDERARELLGEMHRKFDLVRTGTFVERVRQYNQFAAPNVMDYHQLLPIPQNQIDRTETEFNQNPGYN